MGEDQLWSHIEVSHPVTMMVDWTDSHGGKTHQYPHLSLGKKYTVYRKDKSLVLTISLRNYTWGLTYTTIVNPEGPLKVKVKVTQISKPYIL